MIQLLRKPMHQLGVTLALQPANLETVVHTLASVQNGGNRFQRKLERLQEQSHPTIPVRYRILNASFIPYATRILTLSVSFGL